MQAEIGSIPAGNDETETKIVICEILGRETSSLLHPLECMGSDGNRYFVKTRRTDKRLVNIGPMLGMAKL